MICLLSTQINKSGSNFFSEAFVLSMRTELICLFVMLIIVDSDKLSQHMNLVSLVVDYSSFVWSVGDPLCGLASRGETVCVQSLRWHAYHMECTRSCQACPDHYAAW